MVSPRCPMYLFDFGSIPDLFERLDVVHPILLSGDYDRYSVGISRYLYCNRHGECISVIMNVLIASAQFMPMFEGLDKETETV